MKRQIIALQAIAILLSACTETSYQESGKYISEITAVVSPMTCDGGSRTAISQDGEFTWQDDDKLGFWPASVSFGNPEQVMFYISHNKQTSAVFKGNGWGLLRNQKYYSYYPYDKTAASSCVKISYTGQSQNVCGGMDHLGKFDYMHASVEVSDAGKTAEKEYMYNHLGCVARITIDVPEEYRADSFTDITLNAVDAIILTGAEYNPCVDNVVYENKVMSKSLAMDFAWGGGIVCNEDGQLVVNIMMSPTAWQGKTITVELNTVEGDEFSGTFTPGKNQAAGKIFTYSVTDLTRTGGSMNLGRKGNANCYIVSEAGEYKFRAVKGNTDEALDVKGVKVLWESFGTDTAPQAGDVIGNVSFSKGYIHFSNDVKGFHKGNAVIAAYSDAGCTAGNILWSWHIWCTDEPADEEYRNDAGMLMDRNLGALSKEGNLAAGLYYQWGRKDPFPGVTSYSGADASAARTCPANGSVFDFSATCSQNNLQWSVSHPTSFIQQAGGSQGDWTLPQNGALWYGGDDVKTMYDPCPAGYRVVQGSKTANTVAGRGFWGKALGVNAVAAPGYGGWYFDSSAHGVRFPLVSGYAFYPACGCYTETAQLMYVGFVYCWANYPAGTDANMAWNTQYAGVMDYNPMDTKGLSISWNCGRAAAKPVRCMKMGSDEPSSPEANEGYGKTPTTPSAW